MSLFVARNTSPLIHYRVINEVFYPVTADATAERVVAISEPKFFLVLDNRLSLLSIFFVRERFVAGNSYELFMKVVYSFFLFHSEESSQFVPYFP